MIRHTDRYCIKSACHTIWYLIRFLQDHRHRSRPEMFHRTSCIIWNLLNQRFYHLHITYMKDQWIIGRSSFCCINLSCRIRKQSITSKAIDSLCWKCYKFAFFNQSSGFFHVLFAIFHIINFYKFCFHFFIS